jgi:hypothetical protein
MKSAGDIPALQKSTGKTPMLEVLEKFQHFQRCWKYSGTQK